MPEDPPESPPEPHPFPEVPDMEQAATKATTVMKELKNIGRRRSARVDPTMHSPLAKNRLVLYTGRRGYQMNT
jgi:hypothetical protein